jgi:hypothetical protein
MSLLRPNKEYELPQLGAVLWKQLKPADRPAQPTHDIHGQELAHFADVPILVLSTVASTEDLSTSVRYLEDWNAFGELLRELAEVDASSQVQLDTMGEYLDLRITSETFRLHTVVFGHDTALIDFIQDLFSLQEQEDGTYHS